MADRLRSFARQVKNATVRAMGDVPKTKLQQLKNNTTGKVLEATRQRKERIAERVRSLFTQYEKFTGVREVMLLQNNVVSAQERFMAAQDKRRELGRSVAALENRLKELHSEMQNTQKGDEKYLHLCTEEHKLILQERSLRQQFSEAEREERERFAEMSAAVKVGHERERAHAERNKYWYIVASILGTVLGIAGSTINNHLKMAEFRDMLERQMARSASVLYTAGVSVQRDQDIAAAVRSDIQHQEKLEHTIRSMQETVAALVSKQTSLMEHLSHHEHNIDVQLRELRKLVASVANISHTTDAELVKALESVHHDLEGTHSHPHEYELPKNRILLQPTQMVTGVAIVACLALILGNVLGRLG